MTKPVLYVFLISHYCEKARWALDYCGVDYELKALIPANHADAVKRIGAKGSGLPILHTADGVIEGSANIVEWANSQNEECILINDESSQLEQQWDASLGIHIRRWFYSEALLDCPEIVKPVFSKGASFKDKVILSLAWPKITKVMIKRMDLGAEQELESKAIVMAELELIDERLSRQDTAQPFLVGARLSNADIGLASLIAPMFGPNKHPANSVFRLPYRISAMSAELSNRPIGLWVNQMYQQFR